MNRSKTGGTPRGGACCPYCKTFYRHGSMARACQKTFKCRYHNAPGGLRKEFMDAQLRTSICVWFLVIALKNNSERRLRARAMSLDACMESLYRDLRGFFGYSKAVFYVSTRPITRLLFSLWPSRQPVDITHVTAVFSSLVSDLRFRLGPFWAKCPPEMRLYLSGERFWSPAQTKAEAREIPRVETGLVGLPVKGIALGERLSDGRTAGEPLSLAGGKPGIIALAQ